MKVIVIGGGASGLVASIFASLNNEVILLEKNSKLGKKILLTGNGKCNYWNDIFTVKQFRTNNKAMLSNLINVNNQEDIKDFFVNIGIVPTIKNNYYYPYANTSSSFLNALELAIHNHNIKVIKDVEVISITKSDVFNINTNKGIYSGDKVIMSMGGMACPKTGSTGDGYQILSSLGHSIIEPLPALTGLIGTQNYKEWAGIRSEASLALFENDVLMDNTKGEIQLTETGISGICAMNLSGRVARGLSNNQKEVIKINFVPFVKYDNGLDYIERRHNKLPDHTVIELLESIVNYKLLYFLFKLSNINPDSKWNELTLKQKNIICEMIFNFSFICKDIKDFNNAQVTSGGIPLNEITSKCESRKVKGLYITGELLDVDGICGGYNLGFAFMTGMLAGRDNHEND